MSSPDAAPALCGPRDFIASLGDGRALGDEDVQALLAVAVRLYADRMDDRDAPLAAFPADAGITATQAMVAVTAILKAVNVQLFELGMWQAWSGR
ncbi:MAG TPA: hypothetical protein VEK73_00565 [Xanthobacteraceae bacterium]|nr:hypothetical protein [Xanthobacteraceae bacterium]